MKKLLTKILIGILAVATMLMTFAGCSDSKKWESTTMTNWGADVAGATQGGFVVEKENYYYFLNGFGDNVDDNTFGTPVKGALMAVDKNDLTKCEIVVPKLFVAEDYKSGLFIYGDYVYYGTPNTDKNSSGEVANTELTFMKTKLDGSETEEFFTAPNLYVEYRFVKVDNDVVIIYYDLEETALKVYNCTTKTVEVIAKTDAEVAGVNGESLTNYKFTEVGSEVVVYYTTTVYAEEYNENKEGERATASYNKVYAYKAGDKVSEQVAVLDGSKVAPNPATYEIKFVKFGELFYTETINSTAKTYVGLTENLKTRIYNDAVLAETSLFVLDPTQGLKVYVLEEGVISETSLFEKYDAQTRKVAIASTASSLQAVYEGYIYFTATDGTISRIKLNDADANVYTVTDYSAYSNWYPIQFIQGKMFYCDSSTLGASYIKYVDVSATATLVEEDTDNDGENDKFYLKGQTILGIVADFDKVPMATAKVDNINSLLKDGVLPFETDSQGNLYVTSVNEAIAAVEGLEISEETKATLDKYKKAIEMANIYNKLEGIRYETLGKDYKAIYNEIKDQIEAFRATEDYTEVSAFIGNNRLWNYQQAKSIYETEE